MPGLSTSNPAHRCFATVALTLFWVSGLIYTLHVARETGAWSAMLWNYLMIVVALAIMSVGFVVAAYPRLNDKVRIVSLLGGIVLSLVIGTFSIKRWMGANDYVALALFGVFVPAIVGPFMLGEFFFDKWNPSNNEQ